MAKRLSFDLITDWDEVREAIKENSKGAKNGCVEWQGSRMYPRNQRRNYGTLWTHDRLWLAHRLAARLAFGEFDHSLSVCHKCDNPCCVNPNHLFIGTHDDNMKDMKRKKRAKAPKGSANKNTHLTEADVLFIRTNHRPRGGPKNKLTYTQLCRKFNIGTTTLYRILRRENWKHV